jgi:uncharacterized membrane protein YagU involved in acid resistance
MNVGSWLLWGFASTVVLTAILSASQGLGVTRMNLPYLLGTMVTADRDRAKVIGIALHIINGWVFSAVYVAAFHLWGGATWWKGLLIGAVHSAFVLATLMPALPGMHPRMASETAGPTIVRGLEPPGFLAIHYGSRTPLSVVLAHMLFGVLLGVFYND